MSPSAFRDGSGNSSMVDVNRDERSQGQLYPIAGGRYYLPASGTVLRFRRDAAGKVDAIVSINGNGQEAVIPRSGGQ